ncbi:substrate-binding domain-containing protein [Iodobacter fluviatilis]|jgi:LacI family gluconate utilization system Gnt-I transcriptional repressor|uniref:Transcriptional regulator n=1 Tax=Iodobacter fluviatilis TaxID=537 RepID=A0A7G3G6Y3_9NEIS|nr:substrate-binding domain-containing protein [Iodobacter fluviatilis]QBC42986.1 transcriptional regulator [Iodobacter fluviatilis]
MNHKARRPTLQDVADKVGASKMTVSRYLREPQQVAVATAQKIALAMEELGYIHNRVPDMLANAKSRAIGVLLPSMSNQVFSSVVRGIESVTGPAGLHALYGHYGYTMAREEQQIEQLLSFNVDGLILSETQHTDRTLRMLEIAAIPVVEIMELPERPIDLAVGLNHAAAAQVMVSLMLVKGRKRIAYLAARLDHRTRQREAGYLAALAKAGFEPILIHTDQPSCFTLGGQLLRDALQVAPDLDGVFCTNDDIAAGAMLACQALGLRVPEQISVAGFNALDIGLALAPQLASVITPREAIGRLAAERLIGRIEGRHYPDKVVDLAYEIFLGQSL